MADVHDMKTRRYNMSQIKGKNTKPEILVRGFLFSRGFRYRLHDNRLPGKPDIVLPQYKTVIFVNGCFWHGHEGCKYFVIPKTRKEWWVDKIEHNKMADAHNFQVLDQLGWHVLIIFECELRKSQRDKTLNDLVSKIH